VIGVNTLQARTVQFFGIKRGKEKGLTITKLHEFKAKHTEEMKSIVFAPDNQFLATTSGAEDTLIHIWSPKGQLLFTTQTNQVVNVGLALSPDGRFLSASTHMSAAKLWEAKYHKETKAFEKLEPIGSLKGHRRSINGICFGPDSKTAATTSADGTWRLWNLDVRYQDQEDPKELICVQVDEKRRLGPIRISPNRNVVALLVDADIMFYTIGGKHLTTIENAHRSGVNGLSFSSKGKFMATCGHDNHIKIWKVPEV
jgi:WD40 repeat protein